MRASSARLTDHTRCCFDKKDRRGTRAAADDGLDNLTNDFPLHPAFVAFVEQTARYLAGAERAASATDGRLVLRSADQPRAGAPDGVSASRSSTPTAIDHSR